MKGALGLLLVGGGIFLLIELFNGNIHFPIGNVNQMSGTTTSTNASTTTTQPTTSKQCQGLTGTALALCEKNL